jgi:hypothetical protein
MQVICTPIYMTKEITLMQAKTAGALFAQDNLDTYPSLHIVPRSHMRMNSRPIMARCQSSSTGDVAAGQLFDPTQAVPMLRRHNSRRRVRAQHTPRTNVQAASRKCFCCKKSGDRLVLVTDRFWCTNYIRKKTFHSCNAGKDFEISNSSSYVMWWKSLIPEDAVIRKSVLFLAQKNEWIVI